MNNSTNNVFEQHFSSKDKNQKLFQKIIRQCQIIFDNAVRDNDFKAMEELYNTLDMMKKTLISSLPLDPQLYFSPVCFSSTFKSNNSAKTILVDKYPDGKIYMSIENPYPRAISIYSGPKLENIDNYIKENEKMLLENANKYLKSKKDTKTWVTSEAYVEKVRAYEKAYKAGMKKYYADLEEFKQYAQTLSINPAPNLRKLGLALMIMSGIIIGACILLATLPILHTTFESVLSSAGLLDVSIKFANVLGITGSNAGVIGASLVGDAVGLMVGVIGAFSYRNQRNPALTKWTDIQKTIAELTVINPSA